MNPRIFSVALLAALGSGCAAGPDYVRPDAGVADRFNVALPAGGTAANELSRWWRQLDDPLLAALVEQAVAANRDVQEAVARLREARALQQVTDARARPQLGVSGSAARDRVSENNRFPLRGIPNPVDLYQAGFDASWEIDLFGGIARSREAAAAETERAAFDREAVAVSVAAETAAAYLRLRGAQTRMATIDEQIAVARETIALVEVRVKAGLVSELDLLRAREVRSILEAQRPLVDAAAEVEKRRLGVLVGAQSGSLLDRLAAAHALPAAVPQLPPTVPADLLARRADLRAIERTLAAEGARIGAAEAAKYPRLSLGLALGVLSLSTGNFASASSAVWNAGAGFSAPIYQGGALDANVAAAQARFEQARIRYQGAAARAVEEVESAAIRFGRERERRDKLVEVVRVDEDARDLALVRYRSGLADFLAVLDAQRTLFAAQDLEIVAREQALTHLVSLYKALGGGWEPTPPPATLGSR